MVSFMPHNLFSLLRSKIWIVELQVIVQRLSVQPLDYLNSSLLHHITSYPYVLQTKAKANIFYRPRCITCDGENHLL